MTSFCLVDTTDVQKVSALSLGDYHTFIVQCEFITGSDAQGCMVVLVGGLDNVTANLTRNSKPTLGTLALTKPLSSHLKLLAFDIELDGSIGTVAVAGDIVSTSRTIIIKNSGLYTTMYAKYLLFSFTVGVLYCGY